MEEIASALGDAARWRIVEMLAERPRSVGELAELTGLRQPQTTKHLQTLARAGVVTVFPLGQRRVYALDPAPLDELAEALRRIATSAAEHAGDRDVLERYRAAVDAETRAADHDHWADGRTFAFDRVLPAPPDVVWQHWVEPALLASWWAPPSMTVTECVLEPHAGGRAVLEYRDAEGTYRSEGRVQTADATEHLAFDLTVVGAFTSHHDLRLTPAPEGTRLHLDLRVTDTSVEAAPFVAGIETGWGQVLDNLTAAVTTVTSTKNREDHSS